jgi:ribonuclease HII
MIELHEEFPEYGWNKNMGYATKQHREALKNLAPLNIIENLSDWSMINDGR